MNTRVTVLGLGTMGGRTAVALTGADAIAVTGYDPVPAARERAAGERIAVAATPEEAVTDANIVVLSLPRPTDVLAAADGPLRQLAPGAVVVDLSTIDPGTARQVGANLSEQQVHYLDAPVLGRPAGCGSWTLVVGGSQRAVDTVQALLESSIARRAVHVGDTGAGSTVKLLNNLMYGAINAVTAEALYLCAQGGVDPRTFVDTVAESGAATVSNLFRELGPRMVAEDYDPTFSLGLLQKDNRLALQLALEAGGPTFVSSCVDQINSLALAAGLDNRDTGVVHELYRRLGAEPSS